MPGVVSTTTVGFAGWPSVQLVGLFRSLVSVGLTP
jgi:hypothetical protein